VISSFERSGVHLKGQVICWLTECSENDDVSTEELEEMRKFDPNTYKSFAPSPDIPYVI
jgi:hypothetical protein